MVHSFPQFFAHILATPPRPITKGEESTTIMYRLRFPEVQQNEIRKKEGITIIVHWESIVRAEIHPFQLPEPRGDRSKKRTQKIAKRDLQAQKVEDLACSGIVANMEKSKLCWQVEKVQVSRAMMKLVRRQQPAKGGARHTTREIGKFREVSSPD